jgi:hypothetical protein
VPRRLAAATSLVLLVAAFAIGATHADDDRLHAADGCAVCRHVRATAVVVDDVSVVAPQWLVLLAATAFAAEPRAACSRRARARSPPVV